jgi:hypothetical protein
LIVWSLSGEVMASIEATDSASDAAYSIDAAGAWRGLNPTVDENPPGTDNGGFGFNAWDFTGGVHDPLLSPYGELNHFMDGVDFPASAFNQLGQPAFGLTNANGNSLTYTARATRTFAPLAVGETLSIQFDNPLLQPRNPVRSAGYLFRLNAGGGPVIDNEPVPGVHERFGMFADSGFNGGRWNAFNATGSVDSGVRDSDTTAGATFAFTMTGDETYSLELIRLSDGETLFSNSGVLSNAGTGPIDTLEITLYRNGSGDGTASGDPTGEREFFFNHLAINSPVVVTPGDYNEDGKVSAADYVVWRNHDGTDFDMPNRDPALSGDIGQPDYDYWVANFGGGGGANWRVGSASVPEPGSAAALVMVALMAMSCRSCASLKL